MTDLPILMTADNAQACWEGRKTQTRRLPSRLRGFGKVTEFGQSETDGYDWHFRDKRMCWNDLRHDELMPALQTFLGA